MTQRRDRAEARPYEDAAEIGGMQPQAKKCLEPPGAGRGNYFSIEPSEGVWHCGHFDFGPPYLPE